MSRSLKIVLCLLVWMERGQRGLALAHTAGSLFRIRPRASTPEPEHQGGSKRRLSPPGLFPPFADGTSEELVLLQSTSHSRLHTGRLRSSTSPLRRELPDLPNCPPFPKVPDQFQMLGGTLSTSLVTIHPPSGQFHHGNLIFPLPLTKLRCWDVGMTSGN